MLYHIERHSGTTYVPDGDKNTVLDSRAQRSGQTRLNKPRSSALHSQQWKILLL